MIIRGLGAQDLVQWRHLRSEALRLFPGAFLTSLEDFEAQSDEHVSSVLAQGKMLGLFDGETLIGAGALVPRQRHAQTRHRAEIGAFYITPDFHGGGAAKLLLDAIEAQAKEIGVTQLELFAWDGNPRAIAFYERNGFVQMGRLPNAVRIDGEGRDDLFFVKQLAGSE